MKVEQYHFVPSNPTYPVQDKFNQVTMFTGLSKIEYISAIICAGIVQKGLNDNLENEVIVSAAVELAAEILKQCNDLAIETINQSKIKPV